MRTKHRFPLVLAGVVILLVVSGCLIEAGDTEETTPLPTATTRGSIGVRTSRTRYRYGGIKLVISNGTLSDIRIPTPLDDRMGEHTFRFYRKTPIGWERLIPPTSYITIEPITETFGVK